MSAGTTLGPCRFCQRDTAFEDRVCVPCWSAGKRAPGDHSLAVDPKPSAILTVQQLPPWMLWLHTRARRGQATRYGGHLNRMLQFDIDPMIASKWPELKDCERVSIVYRDKEEA